MGPVCVCLHISEDKSQSDGGDKQDKKVSVKLLHRGWRKVKDKGRPQGRKATEVSVRVNSCVCGPSLLVWGSVSGGPRGPCDILGSFAY